MTFRCTGAGFEGCSVAASSGFGEAGFERVGFGDEGALVDGGGSTVLVEDGRYTRSGIWRRDDVGGRSLL